MASSGRGWGYVFQTRIGKGQEPITRSLHLCCTLESTLSSEELFLEQAFRRKSIVSEDVHVNEHDSASHWFVDWLWRIRVWQILRTDWLIGYYALRRDKFCAKTISINNLSSERVDSKGLYGRWRLRVMGSWEGGYNSYLKIFLGGGTLQIWLYLKLLTVTTIRK